MLVQSTGWLLSVPSAFAANNPLLDELKESRAKLEPIPSLLEAQEWDKVRTILKVPPVNKLWNLGDVRTGERVHGMSLHRTTSTNGL